MIVKIAASGPNPGGLVRYSFGKGTKNEHEHQRTVAGNCLHIGDGQVTHELTDMVADDLRAYQLATGATPKGGHVSHIIIALDPTDKPQTDAQWKTIAESYMTELGWTDPAKADIRWTAINHGKNDAGADHIHIIASRVRADGTLVSTWKDQPRSVAWRVKAEKTFRLNSVADRGVAINERERLRIEPIVRAAAMSSRNEGEFIGRLQTAGLNPSPRIDKTTRKVTGYSVGADGAQRRFGGGTLAPDLTLPALRRDVWAQPRTPRTAAYQWQQQTSNLNRVAQQQTSNLNRVAQQQTSNLNRVARAMSGRTDQDGAVMDTADSVARIAKARSTKAPETAQRSLSDPASRPPPRRQPTPVRGLSR